MKQGHHGPMLNMHKFYGIDLDGRVSQMEHVEFQIQNSTISLTSFQANIKDH